MQSRSSLRARVLASLALATALALTSASSAMASRSPRHAAGTNLRERPRPHRVLTRTSATFEGRSEPYRWLLGRLPRGGSMAEGGLVHTVQEGETWQSIAESYLDATSVYASSDLASEIVAENRPGSKRAPAPGERIRIPRVLPSAPKTGAAGRLGLPADGVLRGVYVRGTTAGGRGYPALLDRVVEHGMNAIVLDAKDYDGPLTYPSKVPLAVESGATEHPPMRSYARAVRFAHDRGVRVIARISCFNDQLMAKAHPGMAMRGISGHVYRNGWLDPQSERAQGYVVDLVKEAIDAGADEIQLDYVRYPVIGIKNIDFGLDRSAPDAKVNVITRFVERVHAVTRARGVPLSLDVFGVIAFGKDADIRNLGQDPVALARHSEFLSAMVYPSHYDPGFMGLEEPADHPELVGMGVKHMLASMQESGLDLSKVAKVRPWLQAMPHKATTYGPAYIKDEIRSGDRAGATGWLLWNPGQTYRVAWSALARQRAASR